MLAGVVRNAVALLEEFRPAVLQPASNHLQAQVALALGRHAGIPVVYEVRGFWEESWASHSFHDEAAAMETERYLLTRAAETSAMLAADAVVTLSETMRAEIIGRGCDPGKVVIVPNAVDVEQFQPAPRDDALGSSLGIAPGDAVVGYISSFNAYEGIPYLLEAVAMLRSQPTRGSASCSSVTARRRRPSGRPPAASGWTTARSSCPGAYRMARCWATTR